MGRAIDMEKNLHTLEQRVKLVEDALEELLQRGTRVHHVDLAEDLVDETNVVTEGVEIKPDEEFTPPVSKNKKTKKVEKEETRVVESLL